MSSISGITVCGVDVSNASCAEIEETISRFLQESTAQQIVTINPEFLYTARHDKNFRAILNSADLQVIDGFGVSCAFFWHKKRVRCRMTGVELMWQLLDHADRKRLSVFLATNAFGLTQWQDMHNVIRLRYPHIRIIGANMDPHAQHIDPEISADIVLCNFGAPYQEMFIHTLKDRNACRVGIGVGGAFDFATGKVKRAPHWMRRCGCEWLWRFVQQPWRIKRIIHAVILFPFYVLRGE
jgi:N-acetylglucosaminyldiphosphoundecaprenol N-acetyl-beta-D-mannosaminyltransferase